MVLLSQMLTWQSALAGLGVTLSILPLSLLVTRWQATTRQNGLEHTDARVKLTAEVLTGWYKLCGIVLAYRAYVLKLVAGKGQL